MENIVTNSRDYSIGMFLFHFLESNAAVRALKTYLILFSLILLPILSPMRAKAEGNDLFLTVAPKQEYNDELRLRTNALPWLITIPNIGGEFTMGEKWSAVFDVLFCPWELSHKFSVKTIALLPEGRWWLKTNRKGSFFNVHLDVAWFNVCANNYRYQDMSRPLLGAGIGYGYRLELRQRWGLEFEIGAGMANAKYNRYYNVENGSLKDTRISTYWGIDRLSIAVSYYLCEL